MWLTRIEARIVGYSKGKRKDNDGFADFTGTETPYQDPNLRLKAHAPTPCKEREPMPSRCHRSRCRRKPLVGFTLGRSRAASLAVPACRLFLFHAPTRRQGMLSEISRSVGAERERLVNHSHDRISCSAQCRFALSIRRRI